MSEQRQGPSSGAQVGAGQLTAGGGVTLIRAQAHCWRAGVSGGRVRVEPSAQQTKQKCLKRSWKGC